MLKMKRIMALAVLVLALACGMELTVSAETIVDSGACGDNATWTLNSEGVLKITGSGKIDDRAWREYRADATSLIIEEGITEIGDSAFYNCSNLSGNLVIPEGVTSIGKYAFNNCESFTGELVIPEGVTSIGQSAFYGCSGFTGNLVIPDSVTSIGAYAFMECSGFDGKLELPEEITTISVGTFWDCTNLSGDLIIPENVKTIAAEAFYKCRGFDGQLIIPNGVTSLGKNAFSECGGLKGELKLPENISSIELNTFYGCKNLTGDLVIPDSVISIGINAFHDCKGFDGKLTIPDSVTTIGQSAFYNCSGLTGDLEIPNSVTSIGTYAFAYCKGFNGKLTLSNNLTVISEATFNECTGLTGSLVIPENVKTIEEQAFYFCNGFEGELVIPEGVTSIGGYAFNECIGLSGELMLPSKLISIGEQAFLGCAFSGNLIIPEEVINIGTGAFSTCSLLEKIVVKNSDCEIGDHKQTFPHDAIIVGHDDSTAYSYAEKYNRLFIGLQYDWAEDGIIAAGSCGENARWKLHEDGTLMLSGTGAISDSSGYKKFNSYNYPGYLKKLVIEEGITEIGKDAFSGIGSFTGDLVIPDGVTTIGESAFATCEGFTGDLVIPDGVVNIGFCAFSGCDGFKGNLVIPDTVTNIDDRAFEFCSGLTGDLIIPDSVTSIGYNAFEECRGFNGKLVLPKKLTAIESCTFSECRGFTGSLVIPENVTYIEDAAFVNCQGFTGELVIPDSVTYIGNLAFASCTGLSGKLVIPNATTSVKELAFVGCKNLGNIRIDNKNCEIADIADTLPATATITGYIGSTAHAYAQKYERTFICIEHDWDEDNPEVTLAATCTAEGKQTIHCTVCEETYEETLSKLGHSFTTYTSDNNATCTGNSTKTSVCDRCSTKKVVEEEGTAKGHSYKWDVKKKATTSKNGYKYGTCQECEKKTGKTTIRRIKSQSLSYSKIVWNGEQQIPEVIIKDSKGNILEKGVDYTVTPPTDGVKIQRHKVYVKYKGDYSGSKSLYYVIVPTAPESVSADLSSASSTGSYDDVKLTWTKAAGAKGYRVYYKKSTSTTWTYAGATTKTYYTKKNLSDGYKYDFKVVSYYKRSGYATKYYDVNEYIMTSMHTLKKLSAPAVVTEEDAVKVSWKQIEGATGYQIQQQLYKGKTKVTGNCDAEDFSVLISAKDNKKYTYKVRAFREVNGKKIYAPWSSAKAYTR